MEHIIQIELAANLPTDISIRDLQFEYSFIYQNIGAW